MAVFSSGGSCTSSRTIASPITDFVVSPSTTTAGDVGGRGGRVLTNSFTLGLRLHSTILDNNCVDPSRHNIIQVSPMESGAIYGFISLFFIVSASLLLVFVAVAPPRSKVLLLMLKC